MDKKLSDFDKRLIEGKIESIRSIASNLTGIYPSLSKDDERWFKEVVGTWTAAVRQVSAEIDKTMGI